MRPIFQATGWAIGLARTALATMAIGLLSGCGVLLPPAAPPADGDYIAYLTGCCQSAERTPAWVDAAVRVEPGTPRGFSGGSIRPSYMGARPEVVALAARHLRPLDVLAIRFEGRLTGLAVGGFFSHGALYLGTEEQLRALGIWNSPEIAPHQAAIRAGNVFVDSIYVDVHLADLQEIFDTDAVAILRPRIGRAARAATARRAAAMLGRPFDTRFDPVNADALYCTELLERAFPDGVIGGAVMYHGRPIIFPDALVAGALTGELPLDFVLYLEGSPWRVLSRPPGQLAARLHRAWPDWRAIDSAAPFPSLNRPDTPPGMCALT